MFINIDFTRHVIFRSDNLASSVAIRKPLTSSLVRFVHE